MTGNDFKTSEALSKTSENSSLSQREKHLVGIAVTLTQGCETCTSRRYTEALKSGISKQEIIDLTDLVALTNAGVVIRKALNSWDEDTNKNICDDDICTVK